MLVVIFLQFGAGILHIVKILESYSLVYYYILFV